MIPPDEYVDHVNDSVFTNYGAKLALQNAINAGLLVGGISEENSLLYKKLANAVVILFNETLGIHPEYDGYECDGQMIKQADAVLLHFPLSMEMSQEVQKSDLDYYSKFTDPEGPAMTWGMHSIGYRDLLELDLAGNYFDKSFSDNVFAPFNVWTESVNETAVMFMM